MRTSIDLVIPAYNAVGIIEQTLKIISEQQLPENSLFRVYVYEDASTDDTASVLAGLQEQYDFLRVVSAGENVGRSEARNNGANAGSGSIIIMCDADCRYTRDDAIREFVGDIEKGADAVIGMVEVEGQGFWSRYTNSVLPERIEDYEKQGLMAFGTTQNIAIRRSTFEALGGYPSEYEKYGFEDKDFLIRLEKLTDKVSLRPDIRVSHDDDFTLPVVCRKFAEAGEFTAPIFRSQYPEEYAILPYARCDAGFGGMRRVMRPASGLLRKIAQVVGSLVLSLPVPFSVKRAFVRAAMCAAYYDGTARHLRS
jgi:glycosyltransferase involved in cell wall biosynthesis